MRNVEQVLVYNNFMTGPVLQHLTGEAYRGSNSNDINIYIDMYKMMMDLYEPNLEVKTMSIVTSTMVNLCAHLRSYYWSRHHVNTSIFLVYSDLSSPYNKTFYPQYNSSNDKKVNSNPRITEFINYNMGLLETLCPYLPDVYFIKGIYEPSVIILDLIFKEEAAGNLAPNLVFTRDDIAMQLPACHPNTTIFLNNKRTGSAFYSNNTNAIPIYLLKTGRNKLMENSSVLDKLSAIDNSVLGGLIALTNLPSRCMKSEYDINKAINVIYSAFTRKSLLGRMVNPVDFYNALFVGQESKMSVDSFVFRYKAVDLLTMHNDYMYSPYSKDISYKTNLDDGEAVRYINDTYFKDNPLDLNRL